LNPTLQEITQVFVIQRVEEFPDVDLHYPTDTAWNQPIPQSVYRLVSAAPGTV